MVVADLQRLGFQEVDEAHLATWVAQRTHEDIPEWQWSDEKKAFQSGYRSLSELTFARVRSYGKIYLVYYKGSSTNDYAFMKLKTKKMHTLIQEGILQTIARSTLNKYDFKYAIPRVHTFLRHPQWGVGLCLQRIPGSEILSEYLQSNLQWNRPSITNDTLFLSILVQLATYLTILQKEHGMVHGDLKSTNMLLIIPCPVYSKTVSIDKHTWSFSSTFQIILIDFGFAAIQKAVTPATKSTDLFFLLCTLWNIPQFRKSLTPAVLEQVRTWLHDGKTDWAKWLEFSANENIEGMYLFTDSAGFRNTNCQPLSILSDIQRLYPSLVTIQVSSN